MIFSREMILMINLVTSKVEYPLIPLPPSFAIRFNQPLCEFFEFDVTGAIAKSHQFAALTSPVPPNSPDTPMEPCPLTTYSSFVFAVRRVLCTMLLRRLKRPRFVVLEINSLKLTINPLIHKFLDGLFGPSHKKNAK